MRKKLAFLTLVLGITATQFVNSFAYDNYIYDTRVSLKVRGGPSIASKHIATLAEGKDLVAATTSVSKTEGGVLRYWEGYAYPSSTVGKYTNNVRGYVCKKEGNYDYYVYYADYAGIAPSSGGYLYKDTSLTNKYSTKYSQGKTFGPGNTYPYSWFHHGEGNLNAWKVKPDGVTKYMDGWLSYAKSKRF
ncbi:hypothetical protein [Terrisporobacter sp.]|uniref:hypothetical protein n=1 Tax=Terrisporobacter sp. TaxID=1965305 RepID=UPI0025F20AE2|nr:hypothetical protein [uncultured Terrisporobacter sp.]